MLSRIDKIKFKQLLIISLFIHVWASYFSTGFQHFDEHFQIMEFLNLKWGGITSEQLPWEYHDQIRPWLQTFIYYIIAAPFKFLGIKNPFFYAWFFRFWTGLLGWYATVHFLNVLKVWFKEDFKLQKWGFIILNFLWFAPFVHVRTSSESLSISFFMIGTTLFLTKRSRWWLFLAGVLWGLTYHARFQMALPVAFIWFHCLIIEKGSFKKLVFSALGVLFSLGLGTVIDYWGYGNWNFALWHYYRTNFIEGRLENTGHSPIYEYVRWGVLRGIPPFSLVLIFASVWGWIKYWRHPLTWITLSLFLFHSLIGHKEVRYLFPSMLLAPLFLLYLYRDHETKLRELWEKKSFRYFINFCLSLNFLALVFANTKPVNPSVNFYSFLWGEKGIQKIYAKDESPFTMLGLDIEFYKKPGFEVEVWKDDSSFDEKGKYVFLRKGSEFFNFKAKSNCENLFLAYPQWLLKFNIGNWMSRSRVWSLFYCKK